MGDFVIDPFMGGGTTAVEALAGGRRFLGIDINPLATFFARVKTTPLTRKDFATTKAWSDEVNHFINLHQKVYLNENWDQYVKNLPWWLRKTILILLEKTNELSSERQRNFIRCAILSTGQWALDCKNIIPSSGTFISAFQNRILKMMNDLNEYQKHVRLNIDVPLSQISRRRKLLCLPIGSIQNDFRVIRRWIPAKLVLTSPPYPGVHVVYNRWQIKGRKETPAPYWIINSLDGKGLSYFTLGDRKQIGLTNYFQNLKIAFESIKTLLDHNSIVVQLVGFSVPSWQLLQYLEVMRELGFYELVNTSETAERLSRIIPNRKWYTQYKDSVQLNNKEFLLIHKLAE